MPENPGPVPYVPACSGHGFRSKPADQGAVEGISCSIREG